MLSKIYRWFLARFRLNPRVVCEESVGKGRQGSARVGKGPHEDYHDYPDNDPPEPWYFYLMKCRRCGKEFYI